MTFTKQYIEKCSKAQEIQDYYFDVDDMRPNLPSFVYSREMGKVCIQLWTPEALRQDLELIGGCTLAVSIEWQRDDDIRLEESDKPFKPDAIWLPRQDQLQKMIGDYSEVMSDMVGYGYIMVTEQKNHNAWKYCHWSEYESMEEFWLHAGMRGMYDKVWDDDSWIDEEQMVRKDES